MISPDIPDDPRRVAGPGELESDEPAPDACAHRLPVYWWDDGPVAPFDSFERRDRLNDREWEEGK
jgi:hypothetical protein